MICFAFSAENYVAAGAEVKCTIAIKREEPVAGIFKVNPCGGCERSFYAQLAAVVSEVAADAEPFVGGGVFEDEFAAGLDVDETQVEGIKQTAVFNDELAVLRR